MTASPYTLHVTTALIGSDQVQLRVQRPKLDPSVTPPKRLELRVPVGSGQHSLSPFEPSPFSSSPAWVASKGRVEDDAVVCYFERATHSEDWLRAPVELGVDRAWFREPSRVSSIERPPCGAFLLFRSHMKAAPFH